MQKEDILNRQPFIDNVLRLLKMLSDDKKGCSIAIDGEWGSGKSFILDRLEETLIDVQCEETNDDKYYVFHYNCWQHDYYNEPAVAIISAMLSKANLESEKTAEATWQVAKEILGKVAREFMKSKVGIDVVGVVGEVNKRKKQIKDKEQAFDDLFAFKKTLDSARGSIRKIADERTIVILVDELDRCLPEYAIKVLERLHHLFDGVDNVIVLLAIDSTQLSHSIKGIFGDATGEEKYLKKFIDFKLKLDYGNVQNNLWEQHNTYFEMFENIYFEDKAEVRKFVKSVFDAAQFDIREKENIIRKAESIQKLISDEKCDYSVMLFELFCLIYEASRRKYLKWADMKILADINESPHLDMHESIGERLFNFFIGFENSCYEGSTTHRTMDRSFIECKSTASVTSYLLKEIFIGENNKLGDPDKNKYIKELEICRKFEQYRTILV